MTLLLLLDCSRLRFMCQIITRSLSDCYQSRPLSDHYYIYIYIYGRVNYVECLMIGACILRCANPICTDFAPRASTEESIFLITGLTFNLQYTLYNNLHSG